MNQRRFIPPLALLLVITAVFVAWRLLNPPGPEPGGRSPERSAVPANAPGLATETDAPAAILPGRDPSVSGTAVSTEAQVAALTAQLDAALRQIDPENPELSRRVLERLREALFAADPDVALQVLLAALDRGVDARTGLPFEVAMEGLLASAPSLRSALLDWLGQLDPGAAALVAQELLQTRSSPDEWALALRNLAWGGSGADSDTFLREKTAELVQDPVWGREASSAFLESLDLVAYTTSSDLIYRLEEFVQQSDRPDLRWAAFLATDRMLLANPVAVMDELMSQPDLFASQPAIRASLLARADPRVPAERQVLESYLQRDDLSGPELSEFASLYPLHAEADGPSLVTRRDGVDIADQLALDRAAARQLEKWLEDPRFADRRPQLRRIEARLQELEASAKRGAAQKSATPETSR